MYHKWCHDIRVNIYIMFIIYSVFPTHLCYFVHNILLISNNIESGISSCHKLMWRRNCYFTLLRNIPGQRTSLCTEKTDRPVPAVRPGPPKTFAPAFLGQPKTTRGANWHREKFGHFRVLLLRENHPNVSKNSTHWEINLSRMTQVKVPSYGTWLFSDGPSSGKKQLKWTIFLKQNLGGSIRHSRISKMIPKIT